MDIKQLLTAFERYAYGQSLHTAFTDLLDWTLLPFKMYSTSDEQNQALETYKTHPKVEQLVNLGKLIGDLSEDLTTQLVNYTCKQYQTVIKARLYANTFNDKNANYRELLQF